jgi:hypothetical protein
MDLRSGLRLEPFSFDYAAIRRAAAWVAEIVQRGLNRRNTLRICHLGGHWTWRHRKQLILSVLRAWLTSLDNFRNWLVHCAA